MKKENKRKTKTMEIEKSERTIGMKNKISRNKGRVEKVKKELDLDAWSYLKEKGKGNSINTALHPTPQFTLRKVRRNQTAVFIDNHHKLQTEM